MDTRKLKLSGSGRALAHIHTIERTAFPELGDTELIVASDVHNPLRGPHGTPAVFVRTAEGRER
ncbi:glycerate kinase [Arthrobacter sp. ZGTC412]|uniref:glycerate kinase n=1 Tax=Arthrobacter sp. ZGTC412 TaxID=2058900 RepID=UPI00215843ED|nr:glycerate kinase [Arthrobacter sp. ZGTC412]